MELGFARQSRGVVSANLKTRITENISCVIDTAPKLNQLI